MSPSMHRLAALLIAPLLLVACAESQIDSRHDGGDACADGACAPLMPCRPGDPPARFRTQSAPPRAIVAGQAVTVSVTFDNCSGSPWTTRGFSLRPTDATLGSNWGLTQIALHDDVPNGAQVTIPFQIVAPAHAGTYPFAWSISHDGVGLLQRSSDELQISVLAVGNPDGTPDGSPGADASTCVPSCGDHACGSDGCGGSCGTCGAGATCESGQCHVPCGMNGQACCAGRMCSEGLCSDTPSGPTCLCGTNGHACCPGRACSDGSLCTDTGFGPLCLCGTNGRACCPGRACSDGSLCTDTGFGPLCLCGTNGRACCPGRSCTDGSLCTDTGFGPLCLCGTNGRACCTGRVCSDGTTCTDTGFGPLCLPADEPSCGALQWWNTYITYEHVVSGWNDTDLGVPSSTPVQLRHRSLLTGTGVYAWGYMPEFTDQVTGEQFRLLHLRPSAQNATNVGEVYPAGFIVGISGGDTPDTGLGVYSTGAHLCVQTLVPYRTAFPGGVDACR
jgi:hypothetical protein